MKRALSVKGWKNICEDTHSHILVLDMENLYFLLSTLKWLISCNFSANIYAVNINIKSSLSKRKIKKRTIENLITVLKKWDISVLKYLRNVLTESKWSLIMSLNFCKLLPWALTEMISPFWAIPLFECKQSEEEKMG